jgi:hypothetical protein
MTFKIVPFLAVVFLKSELIYKYLPSILGGEKQAGVSETSTRGRKVSFPFPRGME